MMKILVKITNPERFFENIGLSVPNMTGEFYPIEIESCKIRDKVYSQLTIKDTISILEKDILSFMIYGDIPIGSDFLSDIRHKFKNNKDIFAWMDRNHIYIVGGSSKIEWMKDRYGKLFHYVHSSEEC